MRCWVHLYRILFICGIDMAKERLDLLLVQKGFFQSREKARRYIMTGNVLVNDVPIDKPGTRVAIDLPIRLRGEMPKYVGRGGLKLEKALATFPIQLKGKTMIDIGASTGGFTDCALQNGIAKVFAIDVGYGQLAWKIRRNPAVVNMERTNIRNVTPDLLGEKVDFISIDVSFISLSKVLPVAITLLNDGGEMVILIKPQFEAGKADVGKGGIVRDTAIHRRVLKEVLTEADRLGFKICGLTRSPIKGADGNIEFLAWLRKDNEFNEICFDEKIEEVLRDSQSEAKL